MSSAGQAVGGVVGAVAGFFIGGPTGALYGAQIGMMAGGLIDPPKGPEIVGPRLDDLKVQTSTYGAPIPRMYGTIATAGNIFWLENNRLKEVAKKKKSGGKGGPSTTTTTFSYYATFALGLCDCSDGTPVVGIRRIWCGANLIYDAGSSDLSAIIASNTASTSFGLHNGALDQLPDDRMQASLGVANTPAYRGLAYLVFRDFPLEKYSNSLMAAQFKVELVKSGVVSLSLTSREVQCSVPHNNISFSPHPYFIDESCVVFYVPQWDNWYPTTSSLLKYTIYADGPVTKLSIPCPGTGVPPNGQIDSKDEYFYNRNTMFSSGGFAGPSGFISKTRDVIVGITNTYANIDGVNRIYARNGVNPEILISANSGDHSVTTDGTFIYVCGTVSTRKYDDDLNLLQTGTGVPGLIGESRCIVADGVLYSSNSSFSTIYKFSLDLIPSVFATGISKPPSYYRTNFFIKGKLLILAAGYYQPNMLRVYYYHINAITSNAELLSDLVLSECALSNVLLPSDISSGALTQSVRGYKISSVSAIRGALEQLQAAWPFDVIQSGYKVVFKPRGSAPVASIQALELNARLAGDAPGASMITTREMDSVLPRRLICNYFDVGREYDTGSQFDERLNTDAANIKTIDLSIVLTATECLGIVQTLLYLYWMERYVLNFSLPPTYNNLEPSDVVTVSTDDATLTLRLTDITYTQDGRLECTARPASAAIYVQSANADAGQSTGQTLSIDGPTHTELLDIPLLLDTLDGPGFVVAMCGYMAGWPGGQLLRSDDQGQSWDSLQGFTKPGATIGSANNAIGPSQVGMIDKSSALLVGLIRGDLSSVTELAMLNGANYFAYGKHGRWEIIAAQNCTLQSDGSYLLTDLLRGQQGTEWASGLHAVGDDVILLDSELAFVSVNLNSIGQSRLYRGVTNGALVESASDKEFTYSGVNLECLSPCYLNGNRNAANDWLLTWIRRTRVGGALRDYVDASLGEASEAYEVEIYSSNTYATLKRTITGLTTPAAAYPSAQQVTDFGSNQSTLYIKIYQLSANVGRGYPLITSITR